MEERTATEEKYKVNRAITAPQIRLIDQDGNPVGVVSIKEASIMAREAGLDLVEISPQASPPVCKIINYGKMKYELQKKKAEAKKKQKIIEIKEVKFTPTIGANDYNVKLNSIKKFIASENKVKISLRFRGREISHKDIGEKLLNRVLDDVQDIAKADSRPQLDGRQIITIISPISAVK